MPVHEIVAIVNRGRNNDRRSWPNDRIIGNNGIKKYCSDYKNWGVVGREFTTTIPLQKKFASCPKLKIWKTIFFLILKKENKNIAFQILILGEETNFFGGRGEDLWCKLYIPLRFYGPYWRRSTIVMAAAIGDCYFGGDW